jgi:hypothetical protein
VILLNAYIPAGEYTVLTLLMWPPVIALGLLILLGIYIRIDDGALHRRVRNWRAKQ